MNVSTFIYIVLALILAGGITYFQYFYKNTIEEKVRNLLSIFRFFAIFGLLLLLLNPKIERTIFDNEKPVLAVFFDNSESIKALNAADISKSFLKEIKTQSELNDKYDVHLYGFAQDLQLLDSLNFKGQQTQLAEVPKNLKGFYKQTATAVVLVSDGQSTIGADYRYSFDPNKRVFTLILGDTNTIVDLKIGQINVNKYALYKNKFPVEFFVEYNGFKSLNANVSIRKGNQQVYTQSLTFNNNQKAKRLEVLLEAAPVGVQVYTISVEGNVAEQNKVNNNRNFAIEVIDQKSEIAIVSQLTHPDVGALKRAIESNKYRKVTVIKPADVQNLGNYNAMILYQPDQSFQRLFDANKNLKTNTFIITGKHTDFTFLNRVQDQVSFNMSNAKEDYLATYKRDFSTFILDDVGFNSLPPIENAYGSFKFNAKHDDLLTARIRNLALDQPLLTFTEQGLQKQAWLFGENIWKWRLQYHMTYQKFDKFDIFIDKIIQYLSSQDKKRQLVVQHESFYNSGERIEISAQFFNKNFEFDETAKLQLTLKNKSTNKTTIQNFLRGSNAYKLDLEGLEAGAYTFTVTESNSKASYSSSFEIIPFDVEKQFPNPNVEALQYVANQTDGSAYYQNQGSQLIKDLVNDKRYQTIQKSKQVLSSLIDWYWLLVMILLALAIEWLLRKYHGLL